MATINTQVVNIENLIVNISPSQIIEKTCTKCNITKPINSFGKDKSKCDGYRPSCKQCKSLTDKIYRTTNDIKLKQNKKENRHKNSENIARHQKDYYEVNKDKLSKQHKDYYLKTREKQLE